jgi:uncharacterized protein (DUF305 family)
MSLIELSRGQEATPLGFAREILIFQNRELGIMATRLEDWGESGDRPPTAMEWMGMDQPVAAMPGMATEEQLDELDAAEGRAADALFLELMAEHHRGGLHMAEYAADHASDDGVRELAARMVRNQAQEINEYRGTASRLGYDITIPPSDVPPDLPD